MGRKLSAVGVVVVLASLLIFALVREWVAPKAIETPAGIVVISGYDPDAMEAAFAGRLVVNRSGCLALGDDPDDATTVVLPWRSAVVGDDPLTVRVGGRDVRLGEELAGGGGVIEWSEAYPLPTGVPEGCRDGEIIYLNE